VFDKKFPFLAWQSAGKNGMERIKRKKDINLTEGAIFGKLLLFVLPLMASNLWQTLYNAADMMVVSLSSEANAVGAIGTTGPFVNLVINLFIGFSAGANVMVARNIGAKDEKGVSRTVHTSICMSLIFGTLAAVIGLIVSRPVLSLMGNTGNLLDLSVSYTIIYFLGTPFISLTNFLISILRAKGDTKTPLIVLSTTGVLNVLLNLFFVLVVGMSVEGVSLATSISNAVSAIVLLYVLMRDKGPCRLRLRHLKIDRRAFVGILHIGIPAGVQGALFSLSNMMIQSSITRVNNNLGLPSDSYQPVVDGNSAVGNLEGFVYTATNAVCQAAITFTGQNAGAAKYERVRRVMGACYLMTVLVAAIFSTVLILFSDPLLALYGITGGEPGSLAAIAREAAQTRLMINVVPYFLLACMEVGGGILRGLGRSITATIVSLTGACLFRIVWLKTVFEHYETLEAIFISYPISWMLTTVAYLILSTLALRKLIKQRNEHRLLAQD
jgi:putative MATE family efflux protein